MCIFNLLLQWDVVKLKFEIDNGIAANAQESIKYEAKPIGFHVYYKPGLCNQVTLYSLYS